jgi:hypothetical protein
VNDPRRLAEQDELSRLLLGSASDDVPSAEARVKARHAALAAVSLGAGGATLGLAASSAKAASSAGGSVALKWLLMACVPIAVATVSYVGWQQLNRALPAEPQAVHTSPGPPAVSTPEVSATVEATHPVPEASVAVIASASQANDTPRPPAAVSLQAEITALDAARHALARGDASLLDRYLAEHPRGALREQALWMKISNLEQTGRHAEASALAKRMLASYPNGAFSARARALIQR